MALEIAGFHDYVCDICDKEFLSERGLTLHYDNKRCRQEKEWEDEIISSVAVSTEKKVEKVEERSEAPGFNFSREKSNIMVQPNTSQSILRNYLQEKKSEEIGKKSTYPVTQDFIFLSEENNMVDEQQKQEVGNDRSKSQKTTLIFPRKENKNIDEKSAAEKTPKFSKVETQKFDLLFSDVFLFSPKKEKKQVIEHFPYLPNYENEITEEIVDGPFPFEVLDDSMIFYEESPDDTSSKKRSRKDNKLSTSLDFSSPERECKKVKNDLES
ncbi:hypothetical protein TKK_0018926 [Trichogramma kaykai]